MDTIYALATTRGRSGLAVIRVSGPEAQAAGEALCGVLPRPRSSGLRKVRWMGQVLDQALILTFAEGASFTGEPVVEFHIHGGPAVIAAMLGALSEQAGLRPALAGEFTRRALDNGVLDLTQVEGLADLIDAETEAQRRQAERVLSGAIGVKVDAWRQNLIRAAALLEATIDFAEEDVPTNVTPEVLGIIDRLLSDFRNEAAGIGAAERLRNGFEIAIVGEPNAGKSTLLNFLAGREAAITSEIAGTTRDVIEVRMDIGGLPVTLLDTAGLRETADTLEGIGVARAIARAEAADLRIILTIDGRAVLMAPRADDIIVQGKADVQPAVSGLCVSGRSGQGIPDLLARIESQLRLRVSSAGTLVRDRHRAAVVLATENLCEARQELVGEDCRVELAAENLRLAIRAMDSLVGRVDVEMLLDEIFASFCIGK